MKFSNMIRSILVIIMGLAIAFLAYMQFQEKWTQSKYKNTKALQVKKYFLKYKKPARVEFQNYVRSPQNKYQKDIQEIKSLKLFLDEKSDFYVELQLFTDELDTTAPLVAQFRFLSTKNKNLLREESINLN